MILYRIIRYRETMPRSIKRWWSKFDNGWVTDREDGMLFTDAGDAAEYATNRIVAGPYAPTVNWMTESVDVEDQNWAISLDDGFLN